ncbi:hypothetical protein TIFTF001_029573 [Ficus carica]|uniref:Uncharacterized protein n=1 Tax=Ficus carica TaxID=3494 RepID=A0AA88J2L9_FICCA|nr:hypothetical protein TIFTF001_016897 [Ficus carica]GMN60485.1 hypothetical protein TIFTF001_029573 [Ficus carica]
MLKTTSSLGRPVCGTASNSDSPETTSRLSGQRHTLGFGVVEGICVVDYRPQLRLGQLDILPTFHAVRKPRCDPLPPARIHRPLQFIPLQARTRLTWLAFLILLNDR